jgi:outer membrane protein OmpA-like peptidoglycan-associated protein
MHHRLLWIAVACLINISGASRANVIGSDFQNFNTTTNGIDFVTVHSGQTLAPGVLNTGLFVNYAVNTLPEFREGKPFTESGGGVRNTALFSDFNLGIGILKNVDAGISFPANLSQDVKSEESRIEYDEGGLNEIRANLKFKAVGNKDHAFGIVLSLNQNLLEDNPYSGVDGGPIVNVELVGHTSIGKARTAANIGYRKKSPGEPVVGVPVTPFEDQFIGSVAASYLFSSIDTKLIFEFFGSHPIDAKASESEVFQKTGEALVGVKYDATTNLALHAGATTGIIASPVSPDVRYYAGLNWNAGPFGGKDVKKRKKGEPRDEDDAPAPQEPTDEEEPYATFVFENVKFVFDSDRQVLKGAKKALQELSDFLRDTPNWTRIVVEGHTDSVGNDDYNLDLSRNRATAVKRHLVNEFGLAEEKIETVGFGESKPVADNENYQGRQLNRRVEVKIYVDSGDVIDPTQPVRRPAKKTDS